MTDETSTSDWIGPPFGRLQIAVILFCAAFAIVVPSSLQPLLLGGLVAEGRLTAVQLGQAATAELLAMGLSCSMAGALLRPYALRRFALVAGLGLTLANIWTINVTGYQILASRALSGVCYGIYVWILSSMLVRSRNAARYSGAMATVQAVASTVLSFLLSSWIVPHGGINGGYGCIALLSFSMMLVTPLLPGSMESLTEHSTGQRPPVRGLAALLAVFCYMGGLVGAWVYIGVLSVKQGHSAAVTGLAISAGLTAQILGGLLASVLGKRVAPLVIIGLCGTACFVLLLIISSGLNALPFTLVTMLFAVLWTLATPYMVPLVLAADPTRRTAIHTGSAQVAGSATGPALAAMLIAGADVRVAVIGCGLLLPIAFMIALYTIKIRAISTASLKI